MDGEIDNLTIGINWRKINFNDLKSIYNIILNLIKIIISIINPSKIIIYEEFMTKKHIRYINGMHRTYPLNKADIIFSKYFDLGFETGINEITLSLIESKLSIID